MNSCSTHLKVISTNNPNRACVLCEACCLRTTQISHEKMMSTNRPNGLLPEIQLNRPVITRGDELLSLLVKVNGPHHAVVAVHRLNRILCLQRKHHHTLVGRTTHQPNHQRSPRYQVVIVWRHRDIRHPPRVTRKHSHHSRIFRANVVARDHLVIRTTVQKILRREAESPHWLVVI